MISNKENALIIETTIEHLHYSHEKVHSWIAMNPFQQINNFLENYSANIYLFKVNNRNSRKRCGDFPINFEHISHLFLLFLLFLLAGYNLLSFDNIK